VVAVTKFDEGHCHKWALLLRERRKKLNEILVMVNRGDFSVAKRLFSEIFRGVSGGKRADPGMMGSLLYHMAMVTKMETETSFLLKELGADMPDIADQLKRLYCNFASDISELTGVIVPLNGDPLEVTTKASLSTDEKIGLFNTLNEQTKKVERLLNAENPEAVEQSEDLFEDWAQYVVQMRMRQEYETIKGFLVTAELAKAVGIPRLQDAIKRAQEKFGEETVRIALNVTLKVGMRREKLQTMMLSDHFIRYAMSVETLDGHMHFLNCPIFGSHKYIAEKTGANEAIASLFCQHFCYAHAKAMLNTVLPFTFALWQPKRMATDGKCEFYLKLAYSPTAPKSEKYVPLVVSWNLTRKCNLKCPHCYINATTQELENELTTEESKTL
jgi:hypothetical protein